MATATNDLVASPLRHLKGCPVERDPDNVELAARVETYRMEDSLRLNIDDPRYPMTYTRVTHCVECGALSYSKEF